MKKAFIIATGTELLVGNTIDSNSAFIAGKLAESGIKTIGKIIVGDKKEEICAAFKLAGALADIVIATGGLGPTRDDLTKEIACDYMQVEMHVVKEEVEKLKDFFARRRKPMPANNIKQAMFPENAIILANKLGTAPGMFLEMKGKTLILLPGPPKEMREMFCAEAEPLLRAKFGRTGEKAITRTIKTFGLGESQVEEMISQVMDDPRGSSIALLATEGEIHIRITAEGSSIADSNIILDEITGIIREKLTGNIYGYDDDTLVSQVSRLLKEKGVTLAAAESCTGGYLAKSITDLPGSSAIFWGSAVTYSNAAKTKLLGVSRETIDTFGAVSRETALGMAYGAKKISGSKMGLSITGIAGPDGGSETKPVGLVYIAIVGDDLEKVRELNFSGDREGIRTLAVKSALDMIRRNIPAP